MPTAARAACRWGGALLAALLVTNAAVPLWAEGTPTAEAQPAGNAAPEEEVVVTATRVRMGNQIVPYDVRVVGPDRLGREGVKSAPEALGDVSGAKLNPRQENAIFSDIELRGLSGNATSGANVLVLLDGVPQRRLSFGGPYLGALPFEAVQRMELVKGAQASLYGRNALAGTLQLFSDAGGPSPYYGASMMYEGQTEDLRTSLKASGPLGTGTAGGAPLGTYALAGSFGRMGGWQPRTNRSRGDAYFHSDLNLSATEQLSLFGGFVDGSEEMVSPVFVDANGNRLPGFERRTNIAVEGNNGLDLQEARAGARYSRDWTDHLRSKFTLAYWHGDTHWDVGRPDDQPATGTLVARPTDKRDFRESSLFSELEVAGRYRLGERWQGEVSAGASFDTMFYGMTKVDITTQSQFSATGKYTMGIPFDLATMQTADLSPWVYSTPSRRDTTENNGGIFLRKQLSFADRVYLSGGVRQDWFVRTQENPDTGERAKLSDSALSPSVGLNVAVVKSAQHRVNVYGNYGSGFSPVFRAVNNTQFANVNPETSVSAEAGVKALLWNRRVEGSVVLYQLERQDIVATNMQTKLQENAGDWRIRGIETDWRVKLGPQVSLFTSGAWRTPEITRYAADPSLVGKRIPGVSLQTWACGVEGRAAASLGGGIQVRYASSFYGNDRNSFKLPERTLCDAWLSYDWSRHARVSFFVRNLFDEEYYTAVFNSVAKGSAFEGTPRTVGMMLSGRF